MSDLFDSNKNPHEPLAARMRPRNLDEFIGQDHIVGKGRLLRRAIAADQLTSVIFYGPPGTGKTTLARVIAAHTKSNFLTLNAVLTGVQNIRDAISAADTQRKMYDRKTILFVDEVHRWNKSQQDALLPWVENGTIILVGATTENPFFEVNKALVSRSRVFQLKPLTNEDLQKAVAMTLSDKERGYGKWTVEFEQNALNHLIETANGDARSLLNAIELAVETTPEHWPPSELQKIFISQQTAEESIQKKVVLYDRDGDYHYDVISAFIKSVRGSDPDAALYWLARMTIAGEDPHFIFRRLLISACEDIGLADPYAISVVESCARAFDRIGFPEGKFHLAHATLYLATCPKSNSALGFFDAVSSVQNENTEVPNHLRDASRDAEGFGHGKGYLYPHAYRDHWTAQQYLPDSLAGKVFYTPSNQGYEQTIQQEVLSRRELQIAQILAASNDFFNEFDDFSAINSKPQSENLTFTPENQALKHWHLRTDENRSQILLEIRNTLLDFAAIVRHNTNLVVNADDGLFLWELYRRSPEGFTVGLCKSAKGQAILEKYAATLPDMDKPFLFTPQNTQIAEQLTELNACNETIFDAIFYRNPFSVCSQADLLSKQWKHALTQSPCCNEKTRILFSQKIIQKSASLSSLLKDNRYNIKNPAVMSRFAEVDELFYHSPENPYGNWNDTDIVKILQNAKLEVQAKTKSFSEKRCFSNEKLEAWFNPQQSLYAQFLQNHLTIAEFDAIKNELRVFIVQHPLVLQSGAYAFFSVSNESSG